MVYAACSALTKASLVRTQAQSQLAFYERALRFGSSSIAAGETLDFVFEPLINWANDRQSDISLA